MEKALHEIQEWINVADTSAWLHLDALKLSELPPLPEELEFLSCTSNNLTHLPPLPQLRELVCSRNKLIDLPELPKSLEMLFCDNNNLTSLPTLPEGLLGLDCHNNKLRKIPLLPESLTGFECVNNNLPAWYNYIDDEDELLYIIRIRHLQHLKSHIREKKRRQFSNIVGSHKNNPLNPIAMRNIAELMNNTNINSMNSINLAKFTRNNINARSLKPSEIEFKVNPTRARTLKKKRNTKK